MTIGTENPSTSEHEFDLDITIFETDAGLAELMRLTDDGCGSTCETACGTTCP